MPHDPGDPVLNTWILWWNTQAVPFTDAWRNPPVFHPMPGAFALSEHLLGVSIFTSPLQLLGLSPLAAHNAALILSFALSGFFTFLLVRYLLARYSPDVPGAVATTAAVCAGVAFGFAPYRAGQLAHLQVLTSQWMPLALLAMHAYVDTGRRRWLAVFGGAWLVQALSNGYYLLFFPVLIGLWMLWFVDWRREPRRGLALAATFIGASLPLAPALLEYRSVHARLGLRREISEMRMFSADFTAFTRTPHMLAFWPRISPTNQETFLFPGITAVAILLAGMVRVLRRPREFVRSPLFFYTAAAFLMWWLAFGPAPEGATAGVLRWPYTILAYLPGFSGLRVPARFAMMGYLCLSIAAGLALPRLVPARPVLRWILTAAVFTGLFIDGWQRPMPLAPPPGRAMLPDVPGAAVIELPADDDRTGTAAMHRSIQHGRPLVNGYSGHVPPHYRILGMAMRRGDPTVLTELARGRPLIVALHSELDPNGQFQSIVESVPGVEMNGATNAGRIYVVPAQPLARVPPAGDELPSAVRAVPPNAAEIDLGAVRVVRTLGFPLRWHYAELGERFEIEGSADGRNWKSLWLDWTGGLAMKAALDEPRDVPMRFTLPDVPVRYLRIHPAPVWMQREVKVYGPK